MTRGPQAATAAIRWDATLGASARPSFSAQGHDCLTVEVSDAEIHVKYRASFVIRQPSGSSGPAADSLKPDVDGHRVS